MTIRLSSSHKKPSTFPGIPSASGASPGPKTPVTNRRRTSSGNGGRIRPKKLNRRNRSSLDRILRQITNINNPKTAKICSTLSISVPSYPVTLTP